MGWGRKGELQVQMDIFHRHLPDAVKENNKPDIINIDLMIIQEGIATLLWALYVDKLFKDKSPLKCTD